MTQVNKKGITQMKIISKVIKIATALPIAALIAGAVVPMTPAYAECNTEDPTSSGISGSADCAKGTGQSDSLFGEAGVFKTVTNVLLFIIGAVAVIMLVIGGIRYTISGGDSNSITAAKNTILYAIIGIIVAILAYAAVNFVIGSFAGTSTGA